MQTDAWKSLFVCRAVPTLCHTSNRFVIHFLGRFRRSPAKRSSLSLGDLRAVVNDAQRGAAFLCRISESECRRPLGFLSNSNIFRSQLCDGWPSFSPSGDNLVCGGPLPKTCPCSVTHKAFKCVTQENEFVSSSASLGTSLYGHCHLSQRSASITPLGMAVQLQVRCRFKLEIRAHFHCLPLLHPGVHSTFLGFPGTLDAAPRLCYT